MKKYLVALAVAGVGAACQPQSHTVSAEPSGANSMGLRLPAADTTATVLQLLRQVDLAPAWSGSAYAAMEGFYGPDNYRMSFHFDSVRRDGQQPNVFHFQGRDRYKKTITPFVGTITVTRLAALPDTAGLERTNGDRVYTAFASFTLREDSLRRGAGHCWGRAVLDFQVNTHNQATEAAFTGIGLGEGNPTKGCGQVFKGIWQDNRTGQQQPVAWANFYGVIVPDALHQLGLGERMEEVNPKLARYGWNTIMENDEWWVDAPKSEFAL